MRDDLAEHPDRRRWNARYDGRPPSFEAHELAVACGLIPPAGPVPAGPVPAGPVPAGPVPAGPVLELACGPSGSALAAAAAGRQVTAVDVSDVALRLLRAEAERRGLGHLIETVHADLETWRPAAGTYALVLCTGYWDREAFGRAAAAVAPGGVADGGVAAHSVAANSVAANSVAANSVAAGGVLAWQALTAAARVARPGLPAAWCLGPGEPAVLLPDGFTVIEQADVPPETAGTAAIWRRLLARRGAA
jgi:SAM-dependent methyltransferase